MRQLKEKLHPTLRNYPVRACRRCHHLLRRREQECDDKKAQADPLTEQYQLWRAKRDEIEDLVEEGESIRDKVYVSPEDVERSVELRRSIKLLLAACDALGKQIAVAPPVAPTQSNAQQRTPKQATQQANSVQAMAIRTNIRRAIIQYMQRRLMDVQLFPIKPSPKPPPAPILAPATRTRSATVDITQNRSNQCKLTGTMSQSNIRAAVNNGTGSSTQTQTQPVQYKTEAELYSAISAYVDQRLNLLDMIKKSQNDEEYAILTRSLEEIDYELQRLGIGT